LRYTLYHHSFPVETASEDGSIVPDRCVLFLS
jgi:hypothetical protein